MIAGIEDELRIGVEVGISLQGSNGGFKIFGCCCFAVPCSWEISVHTHEAALIIHLCAKLLAPSIPEQDPDLVRAAAWSAPEGVQGIVHILDVLVVPLLIRQTCPKDGIMGGGAGARDLDRVAAVRAERLAYFQASKAL